MTWGVNDYPWPSAPCGANNPNNGNYAYRNCTDFCQWRMHHDLGYRYVQWGDGGQWWHKAAADGVPVDGKPRPHDVMSLDPGAQGSNPSAGHVAMVLEVGPSTHAKADQVYVEQYDWNPVCGYNRQTFKVPAAGTHFIHLSAAPQPPQPTPTTPSWWWWQKEHA